VIDVLSHGQAVFGIAVGRVWADTEGDVARLPLEHLGGPGGSRSEAVDPGSQKQAAPNRRH
jgi:hypothetical protein